MVQIISRCPTFQHLGVGGFHDQKLGFLKKKNNNIFSPVPWDNLNGKLDDFSDLWAVPVDF